MNLPAGEKQSVSSKLFHEDLEEGNAMKKEGNTMKNTMKKAGKRKPQNLDWKMILLMLAAMLFLIFNIIAAAGFRSFYMYVDYVPLPCMTVFTVAVLALTGTGGDFCNGVRIGFSEKKDGISRMELQKALTAIRFAKKIVFLEAGLTALIRFVRILYLTGISTLGPQLAVSFLSFLYAALFALFLAFVEGRLERMIVSYMEEPDEKETVLDEQTLYFRLRGLGLTDREAEVARLIKGGMTNREIGQELYISEATVKKHITHILEKTNLEDRAMLSEMIRGL
jgi:DNA-binding CsgD family transcriptional regulator